MRPAPPEASPDPGLQLAERPHALSSRAQAGLVILGVLTSVWISTLPRLGVSRPDRTPMRLDPRTPWDRSAIAHLQVAALNRDKPVFAPSRNIFDFASSPGDTFRSERPDQQQEIKKDSETRHQPAPDRALDIAILGVFGPERLRIAVLKDKGGESVSNILQRDMVKGRYRVLDIDSRSIVLHDTASPDDAPIPLELTVGGRQPGL